MKRALLIVSAMAASLFVMPFAFAQVKVIDASDTGAKAAQAVQSQAAAQASELFYQLQLMQEQVQMLQGRLEEQSFELNKLKQQRLDDYISLDRRLAELARGGVANKPVAPVVDAKQIEEEKAAYKAAYALVKAKQYKQALAAFIAFLKQYPDGKMAPNAVYWLGSLHMLDANYEQAQLSFKDLVALYPSSPKVADALYKLAKAYQQLGNTSEAKAALLRLISDYETSEPALVKKAKAMLESLS